MTKSCSATKCELLLRDDLWERIQLSRRIGGRSFRQDVEQSIQWSLLHSVT